MKVNRGDVVLINHPFSDASGSKIRPALVVQNDKRNAALRETIVALITKSTQHVATDPTQLLIDIGNAAGQSSGLNVTSALKCGKLFTVDESLIFRKIGTLPASVLSQVNDCLRLALGIP